MSRVILSTFIPIICFAGFGFAAVHHVPANYTTIQAGIDASANGDTVLVAPGTYTGAGNRALDYGGKIIEVVSELGADWTVINCSGEDRGVFFHSGETSVALLDGFTITNGAATDCETQEGGGGGGIHILNSSPTIRNCILRENLACWGIGIYIEGTANPLIEGCTVEDNQAQLYDEFSQWGCGVSCFQTAATIRDCVIRRNEGGHGAGGIEGYYSTLTIIGCDITDHNYPIIAGGGVSLQQCVDSEIIDCVISGNYTGWAAAAMDIHDSDALISNCIISQNIAPNVSNAIHIINSTIQMDNCLIIDNTGPALDCGNGTSVALRNCTLAGNAENGISPGGAVSCFSSSATLVDCIVWDNSPVSFTGDTTNIAATFSDIQGGWPGTGNMDQDPLYVSVPMYTHFLSQTAAGQAADSPCIDTGSVAASSICFETADGLRCQDQCTSRTDWIADIGVVDMGYHHPYDGVGPVPALHPIGILLILIGLGGALLSRKH